ncbi:MAG: hypothetical protein FWF52_02955, partial [Candidatus Azobacteroides sp.]|nr:hypothetical protein [Candidatus Azobacteroides sp.]
EIGSVLFNTKINQVVGFVSEEQETADVPSATAAMSIDPMCEKYYWITPYAYCLNNPVNAIDADERSTWVLTNNDGTYQVVGGDLKDKDLNIYLYNIQGGQFVRGESIGITSSTTSFYNDTKYRDENGKEKIYGWMGIINPNDNSGKIFLEDIFSNTPTMDNYIANAGNGGNYDFKDKDAGNQKGVGRERYYYRGMPIATKEGIPMYTSARDVGNISAGYVAASNGMTWKASRIAFDTYQSIQNGLGIEGLSTRNAQALGFNIGYRTNAPLQQGTNLINSINSSVKRLWNWLTK